MPATSRTISITLLALAIVNNILLFSFCRKTDKYKDDDNNFGFNPNDVLEETTDGFVVNHGDHKHYVYKKNLTALQIKQEFLKKSK